MIVYLLCLVGGGWVVLMLGNLWLLRVSEPQSP